MLSYNNTLHSKPSLSTRVLSHKLASLARLDEEDLDLIHATSPSRTREIPGGVPLPDQRRSRRSFVVSGWVGRLNLFADGRRQVISIMVAGELVGAHANPFINKTTVALVSSQLCDLTPLFDALDQRSGGHVQLRKALTLASHIEEAQLAEQVVRLGRRTAVERLGHWLLDLQHRLGMAGVSQGERFPMPLTQELLSDVLGMSIVHVNRIIQQLRRERLADVKGGFVTIMEPERLKMITEFVPLPDMDALPEDAPKRLPWTATLC